VAFTIVVNEGRDWLLTNDFQSSGSLFVGLLHTTDINTAPAASSTLATITELSGSGYARQAVTFSAPASQATVGSQVTFTFTGTPTGGTATGWFICTVASGTAGTLIGSANLAAARTYLNGDTQKVTPTLSD
jgi:hypothetical protein